MSRINLAKLNENQCRELIQKFLEESKSLLEKGKYDESAKHLFLAAKVIQQIPTIKRKEHRREHSNQTIKNSKKVSKPVESETKEPPITNNPFGDVS
jgi:hypothetical protein